MLKLRRSFPALLGVLYATANAAAQTTRADDDNGAAACAACGGGLVAIIAIVVGLAVAILIAVWVARDAKSRGMDNSVLWVIIVLVFGLLGLVVYLLVRPKGILVQCPHCGKKRLQGSARCPHCGNP